MSIVLVPLNFANPSSNIKPLKSSASRPRLTVQSITQFGQQLSPTSLSKQDYQSNLLAPNNLELQQGEVREEIVDKLNQLFHTKERSKQHQNFQLPLIPNRDSKRWCVQQAYDFQQALSLPNVTTEQILEQVYYDWGAQYAHDKLQSQELKGMTVTAMWLGVSGNSTDKNLKMFGTISPFINSQIQQDQQAYSFNSWRQSNFTFRYQNNSKLGPRNILFNGWDEYIDAVKYYFVLLVGDVKMSDKQSQFPNAIVRQNQYGEVLCARNVGNGEYIAHFLADADDELIENHYNNLQRICHDHSILDQRWLLDCLCKRWGQHALLERVQLLRELGLSQSKEWIVDNIYRIYT
eukprot:TRINITY_DN27219_c0_g1_i1.p1 TRINITY_DN27219_c0_g1~~TRINITY_DN27219_c0_g1_i1.p1  ORF type:complete len:362 (-),score=6.35 TRINITY_DN27219_c0_g1_i1:464-1510(-)